jgi:NADPH:quinone reductase-like Zn-dependent oxidoreductase
MDAVLESVGEATWAHSLRALRPGGTIVVIGTTSGANPPSDLQRVFYRQLRVLGSMMGTRDELEALSRMLLTSGARPLIDSTRPLSEAASAFTQMINGDLYGKLVLTVQQ